jgi:hypothetical protein
MTQAEGIACWRDKPEKIICFFQFRKLSTGLLKAYVCVCVYSSLGETKEGKLSFLSIPKI